MGLGVNETHARVVGERYKKQGKKETEHENSVNIEEVESLGREEEWREREREREDGERVRKENSVDRWEEMMEACMVKVGKMKGMGGQHYRKEMKR